MKENFIAINHDEDDGLEPEFKGSFGVSKKIMPVNRIHEVYIVQPEKLQIRYLFRGSSGQLTKYIETFPDKNKCLRRFLEIEKILCTSNEI